LHGAPLSGWSWLSRGSFWKREDRVNHFPLERILSPRAMANFQSCQESPKAETESRVSNRYVASRRQPLINCQPSFAGFFFVSDSLCTTETVIATLQSEVQACNTIQLCELNIIGLTAQTVCLYFFMHFQRKWNLSTKTMLNAAVISIIALDMYGMVGIWTHKIAFNHRWEFWLYQIGCGLMLARGIAIRRLWWVSPPPDRRHSFL
jgi:Vacuole effluxer Atg22 like